MISPGEVLGAELAERGWDAATLAETSGLGLQVIEELLGDQRAISSEMSRGLAEAFGCSEGFWYRYSSNYRQWLRDEPEEVHGFMTPGVRAALDAIAGPHIAQKRQTVLLLAWAYVSDVSRTQILLDKRTCNQRTWYQKWSKEPEVERALELAIEAALEWRDAETVKVEQAARVRLRKALAERALDAVTGLAETAKTQRSGAGIDAAMKVLGMFAPDIAAKAEDEGEAALPVNVTNMPDNQRVVKIDVSNVPSGVLRALGDEEQS